MLGTQNGYQKTRQTELVKKKTIMYHKNQPVLIKTGHYPQFLPEFKLNL